MNVCYKIYCAGLPSGGDQHDGLKRALQPGQSPEASSATLCEQRWAHFQLSNRDELGQVKRLGMAGRSGIYLNILEYNIMEYMQGAGSMLSLLPACLPASLNVCLSVCLAPPCPCLSVRPSVRPSVCLPPCLSNRLFVCLPTRLCCLSACLCLSVSRFCLPSFSVCLPVCAYLSRGSVCLAFLSVWLSVPICLAALSP